MDVAPRYQVILVSLISNAVENNHRRRCGQRLAGNLQRARIPAIDLELSSDPIHELLQRRRKAVHRQNNGGAQSPCDLGYAVQRHGVGSVDRNHDDVEPADRGEMSIVELVMQMPEMANAETGQLDLHLRGGRSLHWPSR